MPQLKIRSLTAAESKFITEALRTLYITSAASSSAHWAADIMLREEAAFVGKLLFMEEGKIAD